jgi:hypothetical protein
MQKIAGRSFRRITMRQVAFHLGLAASAPRSDDPMRVTATPWAATIWAVNPWRDTQAVILAGHEKFLRRYVAKWGRRKLGHVAVVEYLEEGDEQAAPSELSIDERAERLADRARFRDMLAPVLVNGKLRPHAISVVAYPRVLWTLEQCSRLVGELESIREAELPPDETKAKAWSVMVKATMWAFFRPHTDGHQRIRERVTVAAAVRKAASLVTAVCADAESSGNPEFIAAADRLVQVLEKLRESAAFVPPTAPGLRFCTRGRACESGYLAWPSEMDAECGWPASLFGTEAQAHDTAHWRGPPAEGECIPATGWSELSTDLEAGTRQWTLVHDSKTVVLVFDALCALSFVGWLWPAAMEEELGTQPTCPDYVGPSLVIAAGRCAFAEDALGGLLTRLGARPFEHHEPDATCVTADELALRRRAAAVGEGPKPKLPWIGKPVEYVPRAGKALPAVYVAGVGAVSTPSSAALCFARRVVARRLKRRAVAEAAEARDDGPQLKRRAAAEAGEATGDGPQPLTADEARAAAAAEGLELEPSSSNETGFKGVKKRGSKYVANIKENSKLRHLGTFATPEEAALCCARRVRARRAAAEAGEATGRSRRSQRTRPGRQRRPRGSSWSRPRAVRRASRA